MPQRMSKWRYPLQYCAGFMLLQIQGKQTVCGDICGDQFIRNLLKRSHYKISYPEADESGDILFNGERFKMKTITLDMNQERKEEHDTDIKRSEGSQKASWNKGYRQ